MLLPTTVVVLYLLVASALAMATEVSPIRVVPVSPDFGVFTDTYDCAHPSPSGEHKIAHGFLQEKGQCIFE